MEQDSQKIIEDRFKELPETIREVITESGWEKSIRSIVSKHNLRIDQGAVIEHETLLIMLGFETPEDYLNNLINEAEIDPKTAGLISQDVNEQIFSLIREKIIAKTEEVEAKELAQKPPTQEHERVAILKEIEDQEEEVVVANDLLIPEKPATPSTQVNTTEQNKKIIEQDLSQKLQTPTISQPKTVTIDPYRELPE
jgi:hypothetical protein